MIRQTIKNHTQSAKEFAQAALDALKAGQARWHWRRGTNWSVNKMTFIQMVEPMTVDHIISVGKTINISYLYLSNKCHVSVF